MSAHNSQDDLNFIHNEIARIDEHIRLLALERTGLLRKLNTLQATTRMLPSETLTLIFEYAADSDLSRDSIENRGCILALSHVSTHWRQVAWSCPRLWSYVNLHYQGKGAGDGVAKILELHLKNSQDFPFSLQFVSQRPVQNIQSVETILFHPEHSRRIETLKMTQAPLSWLDRISTRLLQLKCISIKDPFSDYRQHSLAALPQLCHVSLCGLFQQIDWNIDLRWLSITKLELTDIPIDACARMFVHCSNLIEFRSISPHCAISNVIDPGLSNHVVFHRLQHLSWAYYWSDCDWCLFAINHAHFPALRTLTWQNDRVSGEQVKEEVAALFRTLSGTLHVLHLDGLSEWMHPLVRRVFYQCPFVRELCLSRCDETSVGAILTVLGPDIGGDRITYLPSLQSLTINRMEDSAYFEGDLELALQILGVIKSRFTGPGSAFTFCSDSLGIYSVPEVRRELDEMVWNGFQLELVDRYGKVN